MFTPPTVKFEVTPKVYRFRHFSIKLTINTQFGIQYTAEEVLHAVTKAKIRKENDMLTSITTCWCSANKQVIEISVSNTSSIGPYSTDEGYVYIFDQCKSHCTSSRDHHHGRLVLVVDELPGLPPIVSNGFELCARVKCNLPEDVNPYTKEQIVTPTPNVREKHRIDLQYDSVDLLFTSVYVFATNLEENDAKDAMIHIEEFMKTMEGYSGSLITNKTGLYVLYCYFTTFQLSCTSSIQLKKYLLNERENFMNKDLHLSGTMRLVAISL